MAEPDKRQIGDGSDNYGEAARQVARAARESGKMAAEQAAAKGHTLHEMSLDDMERLWQEAKQA